MDIVGNISNNIDEHKDTFNVNISQTDHKYQIVKHKWETLAQL